MRGTQADGAVVKEVKFDPITGEVSLVLGRG